MTEFEFIWNRLELGDWFDGAEDFANAIRRATLTDAYCAVRQCINVRGAEDAIRALLESTEMFKG